MQRGFGESGSRLSQGQLHGPCSGSSTVRSFAGDGSGGDVAAPQNWLFLGSVELKWQEGTEPLSGSGTEGSQGPTGAQIMTIWDHTNPSAVPLFSVASWLHWVHGPYLAHLVLAAGRADLAPNGALAAHSASDCRPGLRAWCLQQGHAQLLCTVLAACPSPGMDTSMLADPHQHLSPHQCSPGPVQTCGGTVPSSDPAAGG